MQVSLGGRGVGGDIVFAEAVELLPMWPEAAKKLELIKRYSQVYLAILV